MTPERWTPDSVHVRPGTGIPGELNPPFLFRPHSVGTYLHSPSYFRLLRLALGVYLKSPPSRY